MVKIAFIPVKWTNCLRQAKHNMIPAYSVFSLCWSV